MIADFRVDCHGNNPSFKVLIFLGQPYSVLCSRSCNTWGKVTEVPPKTTSVFFHWFWFHPCGVCYCSYQCTLLIFGQRLSSGRTWLILVNSLFGRSGLCPHEPKTSVSSRERCVHLMSSSSLYPKWPNLNAQLFDCQLFSKQIPPACLTRWGRGRRG